MTDIDPTKKNRSDPSIGPFDVAPSYVDPAYNAASVDLSKIVNSADLLFQPGTAGARTTPGDGGFAFADTPEATIFITKKQWAEGEWSYVSTSKERSGKVEELLTRFAIANIITRKLDWLNTHEILTKFNSLNLLLSQNQVGQTTKYYTEQFVLEPSKDTPQSNLKSDNPYVDLAVKIKIGLENTEIRQLLYEKPTLASKVLTGLRSGTTMILSTENREAADARIKESTIYPNIINGLNSKDGSLGSLEPFPSLIDPDREYNTSKSKVETTKFSKDKTLTGADFWEVNVAYMLPDDLYTSVDLAMESRLDQISPNEYTSTISETPKSRGDEIWTAKQKQIFDQLTKVKVAYIPRLTQSGSRQKHEVVDRISIDITPRSKQQQSNAQSKVIDNAFNGVIELTNVTNITTTLSNAGNSTASIKIINPSNILTISEDDIEIAMGTNPLLETPSLNESGNLPTAYTATDPTTNTSTTLKLYRGTYYTERAFNLITNANFSAVGNFTANARVKALVVLKQLMLGDNKNLQDFLDGKIRFSEGSSLSSSLARSYSDYVSQLQAGQIIDDITLPPARSVRSIVKDPPPSPPKGDGGLDKVASAASKAAWSITPQALTAWDGDSIKRKIKGITTLLDFLDKQIAKEMKLTTSLGPTEETDKVKYNRYRQLQRYFQNRTIFEPLDRVYIWLTSPSKTLSQLEGGDLVSESLQGPGSRYLYDIQQIISLINQALTVTEAISNALRKPFQYNTTAITRAINEELLSSGESKQWKTLSESLIKTFSSKEGGDKEGDLIQAKDRTSAAPSLSILIDTIEQRIALLKSSYKALAKQQQNNKAKQSQAKTTTQSPEGLDLKQIVNLYEDKLLPADAQFQVFQGVITSVSRGYADGAFTITLECKDNMYFLSRSQYIEVPNLNQYTIKARPFLDDPIWRAKDSLILSKAPTSEELASPDSLIGRWKSGVFALSASITTKKDQTANTKAKSQGSKLVSPGSYSTAIEEEDIKRSLGSDVAGTGEDKIFNGAGPADIVSVLVTGIPFSATSYIANTAARGGVSVEPQPKDSKGAHSGETLNVGPFEQARLAILQQRKKYGDFQPFLGIELIKNDLSSAKNLKDEFAKRTRTTFFSLATKLVALVTSLPQDVRPKDTGAISALIKELERLTSKSEEPLDQLFLDTKYPPASGDIPLGPLFTKLSDELKFFLYAALGQKITAKQFSELFTGPFKAESFSQATTQVQGGVVFKDEAKRKNYTAAVKESLERFDDISQTVKDFIEQGVLYKFLLNAAESTPPNLAVSGTTPAATAKAQSEQKALLQDIPPLQSSKKAIIARQKVNYLVVSSEYLLTPNLVDYTRKIRQNAGSFSENEYATVQDRCIKAAETIGYEFYADTQGNLHFKPPTYNRVFMRDLLNLSKVDPIHLRKMQNFANKYKLHNIFKLLAYKTFATDLLIIKQQSIGILKSIIDLATTTILPKEAQSTTGNIAGSSFLGALFGGTPANTILAKMLQDDDITSQRVLDIRALLNAPINSSQLLEARKNFLTTAKGYTSLASTFKETLKGISTQKVIQFYEKNSKDIFKSLDKIDFKKNPPPGSSAARSSLFELTQSFSVDVGSVTAEFNTRVSYYKEMVEREAKGQASRGQVTQAKQDIADYVDTLIGPYLIAIERSIALSFKCSEELAKINATINATSTEIDSQIQSYVDEERIHNIPSSLIVTERYDIQSPQFTRLNATTAYPFVEPSSDPYINTEQHWVGTVDFDLWREFGLIPKAIDIPFLKTGKEAEDYVAILMSRQFSSIFHANISVRGDSKYQLGDCVFIEDENMYYYIEGIQHSFSYGGNFETSLTLGYGRRPGYYIPYPFDVLGSEFVNSGNASINLQSTDTQTIIKAKEEGDKDNTK